MVVAGGYNAGYLSSTELLTSGAKSWHNGEALPRALGYAASVTMDNYLLMIGFKMCNNIQ